MIYICAMKVSKLRLGFCEEIMGKGFRYNVNNNHYVK